MPREDGRNGEAPGLSPPPEQDDFGQADYSTEYGYDPQRRAGYRAQEDLTPHASDDDQAGSTDQGSAPATRQAHPQFTGEDPEYVRRMNEGEPLRGPNPRPPGRSWLDRAGSFLSGASRPAAEPPPRRRGPSDRVLWAVIAERLKDERRLDLRDVEVVVLDAEVTLNGTVRRKEDKRRIEDVADIEGVLHVQNNLRVGDR